MIYVAKYKKVGIKSSRWLLLALSVLGIDDFLTVLWKRSISTCKSKKNKASIIARIGT